MKKQEIKNYIRNHAAADFEQTGVVYYLHITDDGEIVDSVSNADFTATVSISPEEYGYTMEEYRSVESPDPFYAHEEDGDPIFERIVSELYDEAKTYLGE